MNNYNTSLQFNPGQKSQSLNNQYNSENLNKYRSQKQPIQSIQIKSPSKQQIIDQLEGKQTYQTPISKTIDQPEFISPQSGVKSYQPKVGTINNFDQGSQYDNQEFQQVVNNLEKMQKELSQWKMKCKLIKLIAEHPVQNEELPDMDYETYKQLHKYDIQLLNDYINQISQGLKDNISQLQQIAEDRKSSPRYSEKDLVAELTGEKQVPSFGGGAPSFERGRVQSEIVMNSQNSAPDQNQSLIPQKLVNSVINPSFNNPPNLNLLVAKSKLKTAKNAISAVSAFNNPPPLDLLEQFQQNKQIEKQISSEETLLNKNLPSNPPPVEVLQEIQKKKNVKENMLKLWSHALLNPLMNNPPPLSLLEEIQQKRQEREKIFGEDQNDSFNNPPPVQMLEEIEQKREDKRKQDEILFGKQSQNDLNKIQAPMIFKRQNTVGDYPKISTPLFISYMNQTMQRPSQQILEEESSQQLNQSANQWIQPQNENLVEVLKNHNASLYQDLEKAQRKLQSLQNQLLNLANILNDNNVISSSGVDIENIMRKVKDQQTYSESLNEEIQRINNDLQQLSQENEDYQMQNKEINFKLQEAEEELSINKNSQKKLEHLQRQMKELENEKAVLDKIITKIQLQLDQSNLEKQSLQKQIRDFNANNNTTQDQLEQLVNNLNQVNEELENKNLRIQDLYEENTEKQAAYEELKQEYENNLDQYNQIIEQIQAQKDAYMQFDRLKEDMMKERAENLQQIKKLKEKLADMEMYKQKYRIMKQELADLKQKFNDYKQNFLKEVSDKFSQESEQFEGTMNMIRDRFQSDSDFSNKIPEKTTKSNKQETQMSPMSSLESSLNKSGNSPDKTQQRKQQIDKKLNELMGLKQKYEQAIENIQDSLGEKGSNI